MKWWSSQLGNIERILSGYEGSEPFHLYIKTHLKNLRAGSKDRRTIRTYAYNYLRLRNILQHLELSDAIVVASALLVPEYSPQLKYYIEQSPESCTLKDLESLHVAERVKHYCKLNGLDQTSLFPSLDAVSSQLNIDSFLNRHLGPKDVFIWCKRKSIDRVKATLANGGIKYQEISGLPDALRIPAEAKLAHVLGKDEHLIEVQDISSQMALNKLKIKEDNVVWDACAGSGGKSMHLADGLKGPTWLVSDKRESILPNLKRRFKSVTNDFYFTAYDLLEKSEYIIFNKLNDQIKEIGQGGVDVLMVDAPCTGSGTWARNPEFMLGFERERIDAFARVQENILNSNWRFLKKGGKLVYMTCSVYEIENEARMEAFLSENQDAKLETMEYFGENEEGDILFQAIVTKI